MRRRNSVSPRTPILVTSNSARPEPIQLLRLTKPAPDPSRRDAYRIVVLKGGMQQIRSRVGKSQPLSDRG